MCEIYLAISRTFDFYRKKAIKILNLSRENDKNTVYVYIPISTSQQQDDEIVVPKKIYDLTTRTRQMSEKWNIIYPRIYALVNNIE